MYQFPDSSEVMGHQEPEPLAEGSRYKVIIIANLLLALFIIAIIWFFFFFDSEPRNTVALNQSLITKSVYRDSQYSTGDYTPITTNDTASDPIIPATENNNIPIIAAPQPLSAIELITNELMKNKDKKSGRNQSNNNIISTSDSTPKKEATNETALIEPVEKKHLEKNQVIIKHPTAQPLAKKIAQINQNLDGSNQQLIKKLVEIDTPQQASIDTIKTTQHKSRNTVIYNSISLKKESDVDKIMLAMGSIKKPAHEKTADKIDSTIKKILKNSENTSKNTDLYVEKLQPESEENKKEVRTITVKQGEKLWDIAVRAYGDGNKYKILLDANPVLKKNPKLIKAGITLRAPL